MTKGNGKWVPHPAFKYLEDLDGIASDEAPLPRRLHRCKPQSRGRCGRGWRMIVEYCACGSKRFDHGKWIHKNNRRKLNKT
jgi:hypothetical protein